MKLKRLLELAGVNPAKSKITLTEGIEDQQAEILMKFKAKLKKITDPKQKAALKKNMDAANATFSDGYEKDNDNRMYGGLDDMKEIVASM